MKTILRWIALAGIGVCAAAALVFPAGAFSPSERILLVSQSSPGTGNDLMLRKIAEIWMKNKMVDQPVGNENVTGAMGENARRFMVVENAGNEHVLFAYTSSTLNQTIISKSEHTADKFTPIVMLAKTPAVIVVNSQSPYQTLDDLMATAKKEPGSVTLGGGPYGGASSMVAAALEEKAGAKLPYTPFKGGGEAVTQLLGNHIQFIVENPGEINPYVAAGQFRMLAATSKIPTLPDLKTLEELGYGIDVPDSFRAIFAPPGISKEARDYYIDLFEKTRAGEDWQTYIVEDGLVDFWITGDEAGKYFADATATFTALSEKMGLMK